MKNPLSLLRTTTSGYVAASLPIAVAAVLLFSPAAAELAADQVQGLYCGTLEGVHAVLREAQATLDTMSDPGAWRRAFGASGYLPLAR